MVLYNRLRDKPDLEIAPRTFFFAGKAAPSYALAKLIIKFINNVAAVVNADAVAGARLRVVSSRTIAFRSPSVSSRRATFRSRSPPPATRRAGPAT